MSNIVVFGPTQSGKTTLLGFLATAMLRHPYFNEEVFQNLKLIKKISEIDEFLIGDPHDPKEINTDIILPSFISMDRNELRKFKDKNESSEGTTKRLHRKQITICVTSKVDLEGGQSENESVACTFLDLPGFRQRISDKYRGFFEGDIGIAVIKLSEVLELDNAIKQNESDLYSEIIDKKRRRIVEPLRVWCDYRSPNKLVIALSQIDRSLYGKDINDIKLQYQEIDRAVKCLKREMQFFCRDTIIPISPISVKVTKEENQKTHSKMRVFFRRYGQNIYKEQLFGGFQLPGDGTLISCINKILPSKNKEATSFSMANVHRVMRAIVNGSQKTVIEVHPVHGHLHRNDTVILGPVYNKATGETLFTSCEVQSLKADGAYSTSDVLFEGNVGGAILRNIKSLDGGRQLTLSHTKNKTDILILKSTILYAGNRKVGDIVTLEVKKNEYITTMNTVDTIYSTVLRSLMPNDQIHLFWYGKKILTNVAEIEFSDEIMRLSLVLSKSALESVQFFTLPCNADGTIMFQDNVLIAIPKSHYSDDPVSDTVNVFTYITSSIVEIKRSSDFSSLFVKASELLQLGELFEDEVHIESQRIINGEVEYLLSPRECKNNFNLYSFLTKIGRAIRCVWGRKVYCQLNGITLLLKSKDSTNTALPGPLY